MRLTNRRPRRDAILEAAAREFGAVGFSSARMDRVARAARVNKQLLFYYFDSKEGLFLAALERLLAGFLAAPSGSASEDPPQKLRRLAGAIHALARTTPGFLAILADRQGSDRFPLAAAQALDSWREQAHNQLREALEDGQRRGYFRDDLEPSVVAQDALAAALGSAALGAESAPGDLIADYCSWR